MNNTNAIDYDSLTGLYSRWNCQIELQKILDNQENRVFGSIDLDNFKQVNEKYGVQFGDEVLKSIANVLRVTYPKAHICRFAADEFGFILEPTTYSRNQMSVLTRRLFNNLHSIKIDGMEDFIFTFSIGTVYIEPDIHKTPDDIFREATFSRHDAKKHEGNFLSSKYGFIPDVEGAFIALREDRTLYNNINNRLFSIHNEDDWMAYLREGASLKENMFRRNQGHLDDLLNYYNANDLPPFDYELLFYMVFKFSSSLDAFMHIMLIDGILIPYYEHIEPQEPVIRGRLARLYLMLADNLISVVRMGDNSQRERIVDLLQKSCEITRDLPHDSHEFQPYFYALCEMVGHYESIDLMFGDISIIDQYYENLRTLLSGPDPVVLTDQHTFRYFEYLVHNARLFPIFRACYLRIKFDKLNARERAEYYNRLKYIREHIVDGVYDLAGPEPEYRRMAVYLQSILLDDLSIEEVLNRLIKGLRTIQKMEYGTFSEANLILVAYIFLGASRAIILSSLPSDQKYHLSIEGLNLLLDLLRKRENITNDHQLLFLTQILVRTMINSPVLSPVDKVNYLERCMGIVMIDTYSHSRAMSGYAKVILNNIIDHYPGLLVGSNRPYNSIEEVYANRTELLNFMDTACALHDIGKMSLTPITSNAYRRLTDHEFRLIRRHPEAGIEILKNEPAFKPFEPFIYLHHRWWNGESGYPAVQSGEERSNLKVLVDILTICDTLEAATSRIGRNYRSAKNFLSIFDELIVESGTRYSKEIVQSIISSPDTYYTLRRMIDHDWQSIYQNIFQDVVVSDRLKYERENCGSTSMFDIYAHSVYDLIGEQNKKFFQNFNIPEWLVNLGREQLMLIAFSLMERNRISVLHNRVIIFFYNVEDDTMDFLHPDENGQPRHSIGTHYSDHRIGTVFSEEGYQKAIGIFHKLLNDPSYPREGQMTLEYADKTKFLLATYTCVADHSGKVFAIVGHMEDINLSRNKMLGTIKRQNVRLEMFEALSDVFETIVYTDIKCEKFELLKSYPQVSELASSMKSTRDLIDYTRQYLIDPEFREAFDQFTNHKTIADRIKGQQHLTFEYHSPVSGWLFARIVPATFDSDGNVTHVIFSTESSEANHKQMDFLSRAAYFDGLTGLYNRMTGEQKICEQIKKGGPQIFALLDCDHFKQINDQLSHLVGDKVLKEQSKILQEHFKNFIVVRMGGDEFVVYANGDIANHLINSFNGIKNYFLGVKSRLAEVRLSELENIAPTMSAGVIFSEGQENFTFEQMYQRADEALYHSKKTRNGTITIENIRYIQFYH